MKRELRQLGDQIDRLKAATDKPVTTTTFKAPTGDAEAVELFARVRAGDAAAVEKVRGLVARRG